MTRTATTTTTTARCWMSSSTNLDQRHPDSDPPTSSFVYPQDNSNNSNNKLHHVSDIHQHNTTAAAEMNAQPRGGRHAGNQHKYNYINNNHNNKEDVWRDCWESTQWLLHQTNSWNDSRLHWREAKFLMRWWLTKSWRSRPRQQQQHQQQQPPDPQPSFFTQGLPSPSRTVLQLLERSFREQQLQQPQHKHKRQQGQGGFTKSSLLVWDDPRVVARIMTDCWQGESKLETSVAAATVPSPAAPALLPTDSSEQEQDQQQVPPNAGTHNIEMTTAASSPSTANATTTANTALDPDRLHSAAVPTLEELRDWLTQYGPHLPADFILEWNGFLERHESPQQEQPKATHLDLTTGTASSSSHAASGIESGRSNEMIHHQSIGRDDDSRSSITVTMQPSHDTPSPPQQRAPSIMALRILRKLERLAAKHENNTKDGLAPNQRESHAKNQDGYDDDDDDDDFRALCNIRALNNTLGKIRCHNKGQTFLTILQLLWKIPQLQPNHDTYYRVMKGIVLANLQHGVYYKNTGEPRPFVGTSWTLFGLYQEMYEKAKMVDDGIGDVALHPRRKQILFLLKTMDQEESSAYGDAAWLIWSRNLERQAARRIHVQPDGALAELVLGILARTNRRDDNHLNQGHDGDDGGGGGKDELASRALSIRHTLLEAVERAAIRAKSLESPMGLSFGQEEEESLPNNSHNNKNGTTRTTIEERKNAWHPVSRHFWTDYLECLCKQGVESSLKLAEQTLAEDSLPTQNEGPILPDSKLYGPILRAWARMGNVDRVVPLWETMQRRLEEDGVHKPDAKSVLDVIKIWTDNDTMSLAEKGQHISNFLSKMVERTDPEGNGGKEDEEGSGNSTMKKSIASHLLFMLSTAKHAEDANRAEIVLKSLLHQQGVSPAFTLTIDDYCAVITTFSRSPNTAYGPQLAENILLELIRRSDHNPNDKSLQPPDQAFTATMTCWARCKDDKASPIRAQNVFDLMLNRYEKGKSTLRPSCKAYTALMQAWSQAGKPGRAEYVLNRMLSDYQEGGNELAQPDLVSFNCVLGAWVSAARQESHHMVDDGAARSDPYERACAILELMKELNDSDTLPIVPDATSYGAVISTLVHSKRPDRDVLARSYLKEAIERSKPNAYTYGAMIQVLSSMFDYKSEGSRDHALEIEHYLDQLLRLDRFDGRQTMFAYDAALQAWMKLAPRIPEAVDHAEALFQRLEEISQTRGRRYAPHDSNKNDVAPDRYTIFKLLNTYSRSCKLHPNERQARALWLLGKMREYNIPMDARLNVLFAQCNAA